MSSNRYPLLSSALGKQLSVNDLCMSTIKFNQVYMLKYDGD